MSADPIPAPLSAAAGRHPFSPGRFAKRSPGAPSETAAATEGETAPLGTEQKRLLEQGRIQGNYYPGIWLNLLQGVVRHDARQRRHCRLLRQVSIGSGIATLPALFWWPLPLITLSLAAVTLFQHRRLSRRPGLSPRLHDFVIPLLEILRKEVRRNQRIKLRLDLRGGEIAEKEVLHGLPYSHPPYHRIVRRNFLDRWMVGSGTLANGVRLTWRASDYVSRFDLKLSRWDGSSGSEIRYKRRTSFDFQLRAPAGQFEPRTAHLRRIGDGTRCRLESGSRWHRLQARRTVRHPQAKEGANPALREEWSALLTTLLGALVPNEPARHGAP